MTARRDPDPAGAGTALLLAVLTLLPLPGVPFVTLAVLALVLPDGTLPHAWARLRRAALLSTGAALLWWLTTEPADPSWALGYALLPGWLWGAVAWGHRVVVALGPRHAVVALSVVGLVLTVLQDGLVGNAWKYSVGLWVSLLVVSLTKQRSAARLSAYAGLIAVSAYFETRHLVVILALALVLEVQAASRTRHRRPRRLLAVSACLTLVLLPLGLAQLATSGVLGSAIARTTTMQQGHGGIVSLVAGARPELAGNLRLIVGRPLGHGPGGELDRQVVSQVTRSFRAAGRDPESEYVQGYLLDRARPELHSQLGNLWFHLGVIGLGLVAVMGRWTVDALWSAASGRPVDVGLICLSALRLGWDLLFSPMSDIGHGAVLLVVVVAAAAVKDAPAYPSERTSQRSCHAR